MRTLLHSLRSLPGLLLACCLLCPTPAFAAAQLLGSKEIAGIKATATLETIANPAYVAMGVGQTHRFSIRFNAGDKPKPLTKGLVAVKVSGPDGELSKAIKLNLESGVFTSNLNLLQRGDYLVVVGCRINDGRKRQFHFPLTIK